MTMIERGATPRLSEARDHRIGQAAVLVTGRPHLTDIPAAGVVLAECALGFA